MVGRKESTHDALIRAVNVDQCLIAVWGTLRIESWQRGQEREGYPTSEVFASATAHPNRPFYPRPIGLTTTLP